MTLKRWLRYYTVHRDKGYTIIRDPNNNHESIEYSTDIKEIKKAYSPLILRIDPIPTNIKVYSND